VSGAWSDFFLGALAGIFGSTVLLGLYVQRGSRKKTSSLLRRREEKIRHAQHLRLSMGPHIVALGGGTGLSTLLRGLKRYTRNITAVVTVSDEGGSSGRLRQEWGMLPPGDIRNCIVALAEDDNYLNNILNFRFDRGELSGHNLGNLILLAATEIAGDFRTAVEEMNNLLAIRGRVLPVTTEAIQITAKLQDERILRGELEISKEGSFIRDIWLEPSDVTPLPEILEAIEKADILVLGPGSLFTSVLPNLLVPDIAKALRESGKPIIYVANLMTQPGETEFLSFEDHIFWIKKLLQKWPDYVFANNGTIPKNIIEKYKRDGAVPLTDSKESSDYTCIAEDFLTIERDLLRHNSNRLAEEIIRLYKYATPSQEYEKL